MNPPEPGTRELNAADIRIIAQLQRDASLPLGELADIVGLSPKQLSVRMGYLRRGGWLESVVALISNERIGLPLTVFCFVATDDEQPSSVAAVVADIPEAAEVYDLGGEVIIKLMVADDAELARIERTLRAALPGARIRSRAATAKIKFTTELPLDRLPNPQDAPG